jgi:hypothetical protein
MSKADISTTPIRSRRAVLAGIVSAGALPIVAAIPSAAPAFPFAATDPIIAALDAFRRADAACVAVNGDIPNEVGDLWSEAISTVLRTRPTTPAGLAALTTFSRERADWLKANGTEGGDDFCIVSATIDDATRGMSGLEPWSPPPADTQLVELGRKYEFLLDKFFPAHRDWSRGAALAGAEQAAEFGLPADRGYRYTPEMSAALDRRLEDAGAREANDKMDSITLEMESIEDAINCLPVRSIEGLRTKALVAMHEIRPTSAGETEYDFQNEVAFQQLFMAVAEIVGLAGKLTATGYDMPPLPILDDGGEDVDDEEV